MISMILVFNGKISTEYLCEYRKELCPKITIDNKKRKIILQDPTKYSAQDKFVILKELFNILYVRTNSKRSYLEYKVENWYRRPITLMDALLRHDFNRFSVTKEKLLRYIVMGVTTIEEYYPEITYYKPLLLDVIYDLTDQEIKVYEDIINLYFMKKHKNHKMKVYKANKERMGYICVYAKSTFNMFSI